MLQLRPDLSFCFIGERAVMLDLEADRYFQLGGKLLAAVRMLAAAKKDIDRRAAHLKLGSRPIFVEGDAPVAPVEAAVPTFSAVEGRSAGASGVGMGELLVAQYRTHASLKFRKLRSTIAHWRAVRPAPPVSCDLGPAVGIAQFYAEKRTLVPLKRSCVPDSLALMRILWRRGLDADLLFGVRLEPFAAHCWVQSDDHVLSDPLSNIVDFTPVFRL